MSDRIAPCLKRAGAGRAAVRWAAVWVLLFSFADARGDGRDGGGKDTSIEDGARAIERAVAFLESMQRPEGRWISRELDSTYPNAATALAAYTLIKAGKKSTNWRITRVAKAFKDRSKTRTAMARACTLLMWCALDPKIYWREIDEDLKYLARMQADQGGWGAPERVEQPTGAREERSGRIVLDPVVSYLALLATADAVKSGSRVNTRCWQREEDAAIHSVNADGGWPYFGGLNPTTTPSDRCATAARLASLYDTYDIRHLAAQLKFNGRFMAKCGLPDPRAKAIQQTIEHAWGWLDQNFRPDQVPSSWPGDGGCNRLDSLPFFLYAVARAALAGGRTRVGGHPIRSAIARRLIDTQRADGSWGSIHETCFGLLALLHTQRPLVLSKGVFHREDFWHKRPRDVANLSKWLSETGRRSMAWQRVDLAAHPEDIMAAPLLILSEHDMPALHEALAKRITRFVEYGGTVVAIPCCSSPEFTESFQTLMRERFPRLRREVLAAGHPVFRIAGDVALGTPVIGYGDSCRTSVFLLDAPASCAWQQNLHVAYPQFFEVLRNIQAYATFNSPTGGLLPSDASATGEGADAPEDAIKIARLQHRGDWWIKPAWLPRLKSLTEGPALALASALRVDKARLAEIDVLWLVGTAFGPFTPNEKVELKAFLAAGGTLIVTPCCDSESFDGPFQETMTELFGADRWMRVPKTDPLMTGAPALPGAVSLEAVSFAKRFETPPPPSPQWPVLYGLKRENRWSVLYCPYDIVSSAWGESCLECVGYATEDALRIVRNLLMYASTTNTQLKQAAETGTTPNPKGKRPPP